MTTEITENTEDKPAAKKVRTAKAPARAKKTDDAVAGEVATTAQTGRFIYALGRRKTAIASVRLWPTGEGKITVNGKPVDDYFHTYEERLIVRAAQKITGNEMMNVQVTATGGGAHSQAEAARLGISRALIELNPAYRKTLKKLGYLTRDPRAKERKKFGLKRARRAPQWSKR